MDGSSPSVPTWRATTRRTREISGSPSRTPTSLARGSRCSSRRRSTLPSTWSPMRTEPSTACRSSTARRSRAPLTVHFRSVWNDRSGTHLRPTDKAEVDILCIYCPETDACYYLRPDQHRASVTLRIAPSRNGQQKGVLEAHTFRDLARVVEGWPLV